MWAEHANSYLKKISLVSKKKWTQIFRLPEAYIHTSNADNCDLVAESAVSDSVDICANVQLSNDEESD